MFSHDSTIHVNRHIRRANRNDIPALEQLINGAYRGETGRNGWTTEADILGGQRVDSAMLDSILSDERSTILVLELPEKPPTSTSQSWSSAIAGCVKIQADVREGSCELGMLTVDVRRQKQGLGDFLVAAAESLARDDLHARLMLMQVISCRSELIAWYERRGYRPTGETTAFPYGNERFGRPLRDDLEFLVLAKSLAGES